MMSRFTSLHVLYKFSNFITVVSLVLASRHKSKVRSSFSFPLFLIVFLHLLILLLLLFFLFSLLFFFFYYFFFFLFFFIYFSSFSNVFSSSFLCCNSWCWPLRMTQICVVLMWWVGKSVQTALSAANRRWRWTKEEREPGQSSYTQGHWMWEHCYLIALCQNSTHPAVSQCVGNLCCDWPPSRWKWIFQMQLPELHPNTILD